MRVLIVDDHVLFREGLVSLLKSQNSFEVIGQAGTVHEAVELALKLRPDLVLMDFNLPDGTGLDAMDAILAKHPDCKILFLTVYETDDKLFSAIRKGAKGYLLKNVPVSVLVESLQTIENGDIALSHSMTNRLIEEFAPYQTTGRESTGTISPIKPA